MENHNPLKKSSCIPVDQRNQKVDYGLCKLRKMSLKFKPEWHQELTEWSESGGKFQSFRPATDKEGLRTQYRFGSGTAKVTMSADESMRGKLGTRVAMLI